MNTQLWLCRAGKNGEFEDLFLKQGIIGITCNVDNINLDFENIKELRIILRKTSNLELSKSEYSKINSIKNRMQIDDYLLVPSKIHENIIHFFVVESDCLYNSNSELRLYRHVKKICDFNRDEFDQKTRYSMGSLMSLFKVNPSSEVMDMLTKSKNDGII